MKTLEKTPADDGQRWGTFAKTCANIRQTGKLGTQRLKAQTEHNRRQSKRMETHHNFRNHVTTTRPQSRQQKTLEKEKIGNNGARLPCVNRRHALTVFITFAIRFQIVCNNTRHHWRPNCRNATKARTCFNHAYL